MHTTAILDSVDYLIIQQLHRNSRMMASTLSGRIGIKERTVRMRIDRLREMKIGRFTFIVDPLTFGYGINIDIFIKVDPERKTEILQKLAGLSNISFLGYDIATNDISVEALFKNTEQMHDFLENRVPRIPGVEVAGYALVPQIIKNTDGWMPLPTDFAPKKRKDRQNTETAPHHVETKTLPTEREKFTIFDTLDYALLVRLNKNSRIPAALVAKKLGVTAGTIRNRIDRLIDRGAGDFRLVLDPNFFGYGLKVDIFLEIVSEHSAGPIDRLSSIHSIAYLAVGQGTKIISIELRVRNNEELNNFLYDTLNTIPGVKLKSYTLIPTILKSFDEWLPLPSDFSNRPPEQ